MNFNTILLSVVLINQAVFIILVVRTNLRTGRVHRELLECHRVITRIDSRTSLKEATESLEEACRSLEMSAEAMSSAPPPPPPSRFRKNG